MALNYKNSERRSSSSTSSLNHHHHHHHSQQNAEGPPNSRLFIIGSKSLTEDDYRESFSEFGQIEEVWIVRDRQTGESKGVTYIKYSRTSEAARAMEAMDGKIIGDVNPFRENRSIRVMIAASRDQGSRRDSNEEEKIQRLFVIVPKTMIDSELFDAFKIYGEIDYAKIMRDKETRESKGFAYIKYYKFLHAAIAFEECDRKYKAVFAEPRRRNVHHPNSSNGGAQAHFDERPLPPPAPTWPAKPSLPELPQNGGSYTKLVAICHPLVNQDQLWRLFDIVPGLDYCQLRVEGRQRPSRGIASVVYNSSQSAAYAKEKIHGFEYPPGNRIIVKPDFEDCGEGSDRQGSLDRSKADFLQIAETIAQASSLIQAAGLSPETLQAKLGLPSTSRHDIGVNCSVPLQNPQPLAPIDQEPAARCFIVCTPSPLPNNVLRDVFSRFGNLIDAYLLHNRNCGFAKFATRNSAIDAIHVLHGAEINGVRIKVMEAEERTGARKRQKLDEY